jgi:hypothetical protein
MKILCSNAAISCQFYSQHYDYEIMIFLGLAVSIFSLMLMKRYLKIVVVMLLQILQLKLGCYVECRGELLFAVTFVNVSTFCVIFSTVPRMLGDIA